MVERHEVAVPEVGGPGRAPGRRCPLCGQELPPLAPVCPSCGLATGTAPDVDLPSRRGFPWLIALVAVLAIALGTGGALAVNGTLLGDAGATTVDPAATPDGAAAGSSPAGATPGTSPAAGSPPDPSPGTTPPTEFVALPELTVEIRGIDAIDYYAITGRNPDELNESMKDGGPAGDHPAFEGYQDIAAQVEPDFESLVPTFSVDRVTGSCRVTGLAGGATYRAVMPQWTAPARVPAALLAWWEEVLEHIRWHEEQHVRINDASIERLRTGIDGQPCTRVDAITTRWADDLNEAHLDFDREDDAWLPPLYLGPWDW